MPEDHAEHGQQIYLLGDSYVTNAGDDPEEKTYAFSWPRISEEKSQPIGNSILQKLLLEWYTYQNENDSRIGEDVLLAQIGKAVRQCLWLQHALLLGSSLPFCQVRENDYLSLQFASG